MTNIQDAEWIDRLLRVLDEFRRANQNITANQIAVFLNVARQPNITQRQLSEATGLNDGTVSRIVAVLSERGLGPQKGADVISIGFLPGDFRTRAQNLTAGGKRLLNSIRNIMVG